MRLGHDVGLCLRMISGHLDEERQDSIGAGRAELLGLTSSTEAETTLMFVDDCALLNHATTASGSDVTIFPPRPIRARSARHARNSANIKHAPFAVRLYTPAPHVG